MDENTQKKALAALERERKRQKRQNDWNAAHYFRVSVAFPDDLRDKIKQYAGGSMNKYIVDLVKQDIERRETGTGAGGDTSDPFIDTGGGWDDIELPFA